MSSTTGLRCSACGLAYERMAVARHLPLATGVTCRRCGGRLEPTKRSEQDESPVVAVRSAVTGLERLPFS